MLFSPATDSTPSIRCARTVLSAPPMLIDAQLPRTVRVLFEPVTFSDLPAPQSISALVPNEL